MNLKYAIIGLGCIALASCGSETVVDEASATVEEQAVENEPPVQEAMTPAEKNLADGAAFLIENGEREGVVTLPSGLQYEIMNEGSGASPGPTDMVTTHYHGTLIDGTVFDSSVERGEPIEFGVNQVIAGWTEALQLMNTGAKWKLFIPSSLAYGPQQRGPVIGPNSTLVFEVELLSFRPAQ